MGMVMQYTRIRADELIRLRVLLRDDPNRAFDFYDELADDEVAVPTRTTDLDKAWAALDFLLERTGAPVDVIHGGERLGEDEWGYEPPRYLDPGTVSTAARYLARTPFDELFRHYEPTAMAGLYPEIWDHSAGTREYLRSHYDDLTVYFRHAADAGDGVVLYLS